MILFYQNNKSQILQFLRLAFLSGLIFMAAALIIVSILAFVYRDNIKQGFINNINRGVKTEIYIDDISVNIFRHFPHLSLTLKNVKVIGTENVSVTDTLLYAHRMYFQMSILDLLRKDYKIRRLEIARAKLDMKVFPDMSNNYTFWETDEGGSEEDFSFELQRVVLSQVEFSYTDYHDKHFVGLLLRKAEMQGNFSQNSYLMKIKGDLFLDELIIDDVSMGREKNLEFNLGFDVENNKIFHFRQGNFNLGSNILYAEGSLDFSGDDPYLDIHFSGKQLKFENFIKDLPPAYAKYFDGYRSRGDFYFDASIKGTFSSLVNPYISAGFGIKSGELYHRKSNRRFHDLNFDAVFDNGQRRNLTTSRLELKGLRANLNDGSLRADGTIFNFDKPQLDMVLFSDIEAGDWYRFLQIDTLKSASGKLLVDLAYKGGLGINGRFTSQDFLGSNITGVVKAENVSFTLKNDPLHYHKIMADFLFNNNDIVVNEFSGNASGSDFKLRGYFRNVLPWLFLENEKIFIDAGLQSSNINFNELLQHNISESDTTYKLRLSDKIEFHLTADIGKLAFRKFEASGVNGKLSMRAQVFTADDIVFSSMKGNIKASGYINGKNENKLLIGCDATVNGVDVFDLFYQMGNFGQTSIVDENLRGRATANVSFHSQWSPYLNIDWSSLEITADIRIENGELIEYKPMLALSRFLRVGDLNHVRFSTLENQIRVKDKKIIIPDMEINSSAINIKLSGEHSFENDIHYRLQVLLSDLLARRNRQNRNPQEQYGDIIDDGLGRTTLFLLVTGNIDDPVFRYDRQGVREKLREDFRKERQTLRDVFRAEFGLQKQETLPNETPDQPETQRQKQQREIKKREEGRFVIEWDED
jgi:hypothetical protein